MQGRLPEEIAAVLARGGQVVTANARSARALLSAYAHAAGAEGRRSWRTPLLSDWDSWVSRLYTQLQLHTALPLLLTPLQEISLWLRVQREDAQRVVAPYGLARLAMQAYALLWQYRAREALSRGWDAHGDAERFQAWLEAFERECASLGAASAAQRESLAAAHLAKATLPPEVLLEGFDRITPAQQHVLAALEAAGVSWRIRAPDSQPTQAYLFEAVETRQELEQCALWVRAQLEQDSTRRIGVLVPQLERVRASLDRAMRRVLLPQSSRSAVPGPLPWEFSLGVPLAEVPAISTALTLLRWLSAPLAAAEISGLLLGSFLAAEAAEAGALHSAESALRRKGRLRAEMSLSSFVSASRGLLPEPVHQRLSSLERWALPALRRVRDYVEGAAIAAEALQRAGWPGGVERGSPLFQAQEAWNRLLDQTAMLAMLGEAAEWSACLAALRNGAAHQLFSEESIQAPVQIMGVAEASGQTFDAVWTMNLTEESWPPQGRMHPLLPAALQRAHGMPHADRDADAALAETQLRRIAASAPLLAWSYARADAGVEQRPSPMWPLVSAGAVSLLPAATPAQQPKATVLLPELLRGAPWPDAQIAGGSEILKQQAACAFQSFARARLRVAVPEDAAWGLDARERATLLHAALERLWCTAEVAPGTLRLHSSGDLRRAMDTGDIEDILTDAVAHAMQPAERQAQGDPWMRRWLAVESERMRRRLGRWLEVESERAAFEVAALEQRIDDASIDGLRLRLRLDRADRLADGSTLLLDYKTADNVTVKQWEGPRPEEPQLPIYAQYGGWPHVAAVAFAQLRAGEKTGMHALAEDPERQLGSSLTTSRSRTLRGVLTPEIRAGWEAALHALAGQFLEGDATADPLHGDRTCDRCGLHALCRIRSQQGAPAASEDGDDA